MKNHRFLWLRNRTTDNRKCEKARNIKEKRTIEMFNTVSKQLVALRSSASADRTQIYNSKAQKPRKYAISGVFLYPFRLIAFELFAVFDRMWPRLTHFIRAKNGLTGTNG